jgi:hypothetical protein
LRPPRPLREAAFGYENLEFAAVEGICGSPGFFFGGFFFEILAFVGMGFAFADANLDFYSTILPVEAEGDEGLTFYGAGFEKLIDLGPVQQEFTRSFSVVLLVTGAFIWLNISVIEEHFLVFDPGERVTQIGEAGTDRFYLSTREADTGFDLVDDLIIVECTPI